MNFSLDWPVEESYWGLDSKAFSRSQRDWMESSEETRASRLAVPLGAVARERVAICSVGAAGVGAMVALLLFFAKMCVVCTRNEMWAAGIGYTWNLNTPFSARIFSEVPVYWHP